MATEQPEAKLCKFVRFTTEVVHRSKLLNAPYNPRTLQETARRKLRANLKKVGLVEPPVWNERTGNLVGGHQRVSILDSLMGTDNYLLPVAKVDFDDKTEREQNIFLNNEEAQGDWDYEKMFAMFRDDKIDPDAAGFDPGAVYQMFGQSALIENPEALAKLAEDYRELNRKHKASLVKLAARDNADFYTVLVFRTDKERMAVQDLLGMAEDRYIGGWTFLAQVAAVLLGKDQDLKYRLLNWIENDGVVEEADAQDGTGDDGSGGDVPGAVSG